MKIIDGDFPYIKYVWVDSFENVFGCENCKLQKNKELCPNDCKPENGFYRLMTLDEMRSEQLRERWTKSGLLQRWNNKKIYKI